MKYLKKYKLFKESDEFEIEDTDSPDLKMSKDRMNTIKSQISDYNSKKSRIDSLYKSDKGTDIQKGLEDIIGKIGDDKSDRNPFLIEYAHLSSLERNINKLHDDNSNDKIKIDDLQQSLGLVESDDTKKSIESKISDIKNRMSERSSKISDIEKDLSDKEKDHKERMSKMGEEMKKHIQNMTSSDQK